MKTKMIALIVMLILTHSLLADTTWVQNPIMERFWTVEGSPYVITEESGASLHGNDTLTIEPGVTVLMDTFFSGFYIGTILRQHPVLIANGTEDDSIYFLPLNPEYHWGGIYIRTSAVAQFSHCVFSRIGNDNFEKTIYVDGLLGLASFKNCTFRDGIGGFAIETWGEGTGITVEDCHFINCIGGGILNRGGNARVRRTVIDNVGYPANGVDFVNCLIVGRGRNIRVNESNILQNTIFIDVNVNTVGELENSPFIENFSNNIFFGRENPEDYFRDPEEIDGIGILSRTNENGDSTDAYGNLFINPLLDIEGDYPDYYHILEDSPCIDAGNPESDPDPDGTIADIGAYFFPQRNIAVNPDEVLEFDTPGAEDTVTVSIFNIGLQDLRVFSVTLDAEEGSPFSLAGDEIRNKIVSPGDSIVVPIRFYPPGADDYEADLFITSDDRDQSEIHIWLIGHSQSVETTVPTPTDFALTGAYPNPFNSTTTIGFSLPAAGNVSLAVYDLSGREVARLADGVKSAGTHEAVWTADGVSSGVYVVALDAGGVILREKVVLVK